MAEDLKIPDNIMDFLMGIQAKGIEDEARWLAERTPYCAKGQTILLGDSITAQFPINEMDRSLEVYNRGISGDTTDNVLNRLDSTVLQLEPRQVFLMIGTNDIGNGKSPEYVHGNTAEIIRRIRERLPECEIFLHDVLHVNREMSVPPFNSVGCRTNELIDAVNRLNADMGSVTHISLNGVLDDGAGSLDGALSKDGLHLNYQGYLKYLEFIKPFLK